MRRFEDVVLNQNGTPVAGALVTVFLPGTQIPAVLYSDDGLTPIPNPVTTNSVASGNPGLFSFFIASGKYDFQVSGGQIATYVQKNVEIADIYEFKTTDLQPWVTQTLQLNELTTGATPPLGNVNLYTKTVDKNLYYKDDTGREVGPLSSGGGIPAAPVNALQKNSAGVFGASNLTDNGTVLSVNEDSQFIGPNPYVDVRNFGVRSPSVTPSTTATINGGSATALLASASTFQNGDGIVIYGAGPTNALSTPGPPTVTSVLSKSSLRVGNVTAANAGSTTYNYQIACQDKLGALTAASAVGTTTTGLANLGAVSAGLVSLTRTGNSVAVVTSAPTDLVVGAAVYIQGTSDSSFHGAHMVSAVTDSQHFTYAQAISTALGASLTATGGSVTWYSSNHITFTLPTNAWKCAVYGRTGGLTLLGFSKPLEGYFDDYGSTAFFNGESIMGQPFVPPYIPNTPPAVATNDPLVTTIVSGAGTTTLTLASTATNSVAGATTLFDAGITLKAAVAAAGGAPVYIPSGAGLTINAYTTLTGTIWQAGTVTLNDTLEFTGTWYGDMGGTGGAGAQFAWTTARSIQTNAAPGIYLPNPANRFRNLSFNSNFDQALNVLAEGNFEQATFDFCQFGTGIAGLQFDALGIAYEERGAVNTTFHHTLFICFFNNTGPLGLWAPALFHTGSLNPINGPGGYLTLYKTMIVAKGITFQISAQSSVNAGNIDQIYAQGNRTPFIVFDQTVGGGLLSNWRITSLEEDTSLAPAVTNLTTGVLNTIEISNIGSLSGPLLTGNPVSNLVSNAPVIGSYLGGVASFFKNDAKMTVFGPGTFQSGMLITQTPPAAVVSAGGSLSVGSHTYNVQFVDVNGNGSPITPTVSASPTPGNQTVTITPAAFPVGSISWIIYRDGAPLQHPICVFQPIPVSTTAFVDNGVSSCGSLSLASNAGTSIVGPLGLSTPTLKLISNGFTSTTDFPSILTANQNMHVPNATGTITLVNSASAGQVLQWNGTSAVGTTAPAGSTVYNTTATASATNIAQTSMVTAPANQNYLFTAYLEQTNTTSGCSSQPTFQVTLIWTDAFTGTFQSAIVPMASGAGIIVSPTSFQNSSPNFFAGSYALRAKSGTPVSYTVAYFAGSGCSVGGNYAFAPNLTQQ